MDIKFVQELADIQQIEALARVIIPEFYGDIIPLEHCLFFVEKFQTTEVIKEQLLKGYEYYLLQEKNVPLGYFGIQFLPDKSTLVLSKLYLLNTQRGLGLGTSSMAFVVERAKHYKANKIVLTVNRQKTKTIQFYQKNGFVVTKDLVNHFENGQTILNFEMTKEMC